MGTLFVYIGCASAINGGASPKTGGTILQVALTFGVAIFALACTIGHHSGGQMNCAVTLALVITGDVSPLQGILNVLSQILGSIVAATLLAATFPAGVDMTSSLGSNMVATPGYSPMNAMLGEILMTFLLVFVVLESAVNTASANSRVIAPLAIGMAVFLAHSVLIAVDGCSINPTRSLGPAIVASIRNNGASPGDIWKHHYVFWVGPLVGAALAAVMAKFWWHRKQDPVGEKGAEMNMEQKSPGAV